ncbi:hypothetical protein [Burkholderia cenocepacia]|uniref:hypothetical protein n=1 Tax=Burkholderia cenocepacia TaxID=95486 RepID=UPI0026548B71|nr:hypothetical protein [Burkholderia cenocepacia]MDN7537051.1 hypothetical protein [Burkholderia cenocepacia]
MHVIAATLALAGCKPYRHLFGGRVRVMATLKLGELVLRMPENDVSSQADPDSYVVIEWDEVPGSMWIELPAAVLRHFLEEL